jgi:hypothetical protein
MAIAIRMGQQKWSRLRVTIACNGAGGRVGFEINTLRVGPLMRVVIQLPILFGYIDLISLYSRCGRPDVATIEVAMSPCCSSVAIIS